MQTVLDAFDSISLADLKARANLMRRRDTKYVLGRAELQAFLAAQTEDYEVLEIAGQNRFQYSSSYLDSPDLHTFFDHNQGRRRRFKIRFRHYHETGLYFFEIKLKGFRNETLKYRLPTDKAAYEQPELPAHLLQFANQKLQKHYYQTLTYPLCRSVRVDYIRSTLVAKQGAERITIDNEIGFYGSQGAEYLPADRFVVELKSALGRSVADRWLWRHQAHPVKRCSKYGMGVNLLKLPEQNTRFRPIIRRYFIEAAREVSA